MQIDENNGIDFDIKPDPIARVVFQSAIGPMEALCAFKDQDGKREPLLWFGWADADVDGEPLRVALEVVWRRLADGGLEFAASGYADVQWKRSKLPAPYAFGILDLKAVRVHNVAAVDDAMHKSKRGSARWSGIFQAIAVMLGRHDTEIVDRATSALTQVHELGWQTLAARLRHEAESLMAEVDAIEARAPTVSAPRR